MFVFLGVLWRFNLLTFFALRFLCQTTVFIMYVLGIHIFCGEQSGKKIMIICTIHIVIRHERNKNQLLSQGQKTLLLYHSFTDIFYRNKKTKQDQISLIDKLLFNKSFFLFQVRPYPLISYSKIYIPQWKVQTASSSGSQSFIVCLNCCRMVDSVPIRHTISILQPILSYHLLTRVR